MPRPGPPEQPPHGAPDEVKKLYQAALKKYELELYWERKLSAEGMPAEPYRKQLRGKRGTPERNRPRPRDFPVAPPGSDDTDWGDATAGDSSVTNDGSLAWHDAIPTSVTPPPTEVEALMQAAPFTIPMVSSEERAEISDLVADAVDQLPEVCQEVFNMWSTGYGTRRSIARELDLSQTQVVRVMREAKALLRILLEDHPLVQDYLEEM